MLKVLGLGKDEAAQVTEEEIRMLVAESHEAGVIDAHERDMIEPGPCAWATAPPTA